MSSPGPFLLIKGTAIMHNVHILQSWTPVLPLDTSFWKGLPAMCRCAAPRAAHPCSTLLASASSQSVPRLYCRHRRLAWSVFPYSNAFSCAGLLSSRRGSHQLPRPSAGRPEVISLNEKGPSLLLILES